MTRRSQAMVHPLIKSTAVEIAGTVYEEMAKDAYFYKRYPDQKHFINYTWMQFITEARKALSLMLGSNADEDTKKQIYEALMLNEQLPNLNLKKQLIKA